MENPKDKQIRLFRGDCLAVLKKLQDNSVDAVVTDPPYGISFMGRKWDYDVPSIEIWAECLRVLKPGGHLLAFAGTRTQHRMAVRIEDAGFEIRDIIAWCYSSGFPKSLDVGKALDKMAGVEREVLGESPYNARRPNPPESDRYAQAGHKAFITAPATAEAKHWSGWGTALKPAIEPITLARKPLEGTVASNVLSHGTGAINIDACRIPTDDNLNGGGYSANYAGSSFLANGGKEEFVQPSGRWPANFIHDGSAEVVSMFPTTAGAKPRKPNGKNIYGGNSLNSSATADSTTRGFTDSGGSAARFFYVSKASKRDRDEGLDHLESKLLKGFNSSPRENHGEVRDESSHRNNHPTVKPTDLMRYLCRLVTPVKGVVLDPFMGSGSTGKAAMLEGFRFIGIEREVDYFEIAKARIVHAKNAKPQPVNTTKPRSTPKPAAPVAKPFKNSLF